MNWFRSFLNDIKRIIGIDSGRKLLITELIVILILIQGLYAVRPMPKIWPFSNYPMFSYSRELETVAHSIRLTGITQEGKEINLDYPRCFMPMDRISFSNTMLYNSGDVPAQQKVLDGLLRNLFKLYEHNRTAGIYKCRKIIGLKVYHQQWDWTDVPPENAIHKDELIYSLVNGKSTYY